MSYTYDRTAADTEIVWYQGSLKKMMSEKDADALFKKLESKGMKASKWFHDMTEAGFEVLRSADLQDELAEKATKAMGKELKKWLSIHPYKLGEFSVGVKPRFTYASNSVQDDLNSAQRWWQKAQDK